MKIYTKTGDEGETGLFAGGRVPKDDPRIEAFGTVDELNSILGLVIAAEPGQDLSPLLSRLQNELFAVGAQLATPQPDQHGTDMIEPSHVEALERDIDQYQEQLPELRQFILPGGCPAAAMLHCARTVCRRAERHVVTLQRSDASTASPCLLTYLNRLGDLLFVLGRAANQQAGHGETPWPGLSGTKE
ncbi:MAG: cob(I)yrinic acid a,c-diamide adenosyltransferase [Pirellulaceae bacterium]